MCPVNLDSSFMASGQLKLSDELGMLRTADSLLSNITDGTAICLQPASDRCCRARMAHGTITA
ncbi:hypothetical protein UF78_09325 [Stutzerimonas stutzeri]|uniref:Uncharacterized protein n=1 Tax=Stutzerimonas stutzeri TaxID=316 RepID=A0A0D9ASH8_STUST|nr:hypothetical protein UF78_09325 [Stutzerimonas stutzeri]